MKLPDQAITEYQAIFAEEMGREISESEAREQAQNLIHLCLILIKPNGTPTKNPATSITR